MSTVRVVAAKPTAAFVGAAWLAVGVFSLTFLTALWRMPIPEPEVYFYVTVFAFGLFGVVSVVTSVRDKEEGVPVTGVFYGLSWVAAAAPVLTMGWYLWQVSGLDELQRGLLFLTYVASVFAAIVVQKNIRDTAEWRAQNPPQSRPRPAPASPDTAEADPSPRSGPPAFPLGR